MADPIAVRFARDSRLRPLATQRRLLPGRHRADRSRSGEPAGARTVALAARYARRTDRASHFRRSESRRVHHAARCSAEQRRIRKTARRIVPARVVQPRRFRAGEQPALVAEIFRKRSGCPAGGRDGCASQRRTSRRGARGKRRGNRERSDPHVRLGRYRCPRSRRARQHRSSDSRNVGSGRPGRGPCADFCRCRRRRAQRCRRCEGRLRNAAFDGDGRGCARTGCRAGAHQLLVRRFIEARLADCSDGSRTAHPSNVHRRGRHPCFVCARAGRRCSERDVPRQDRARRSRLGRIDRNASRPRSQPANAGRKFRRKHPAWAQLFASWFGRDG